jgi:chromosomal replication initiation ATPase DnaA
MTMTTPPRQLILDWPHHPSFAREDFLSAPSNHEAMGAIDRWPDWPGRMLLLVGPEGSGKSHLAALWAETADAVAIRGETLAEESARAAVEGAALLIEDADRVGDAEERLFHLLNSALHTAAWVLLTAREPPDAWRLTIPDLLSRLRLAPVLRLEAPDVELIQAVLFKLFSDRQLQVEPRVIAYITTRIERSLGAARRLVATLDREALAKGGRVTRAMAAKVMRDIASHESP